MIEVDYLWVGEHSDTGDAIACRFTRPDTGTVAVMIVDGGFKEVGPRLVDHVRSRYGTDYVDLVVSTHPDNDHIGGLFTVVDELRVGRLLLHQPSAYGYGKDDDVKAELADELAALAATRGVPVTAPFTGQQYLGGAVTVVGPTEDYYRALLPQEGPYGSSPQALARLVASAGRAAKRVAARALFGDPGESLIDDNGGTTPRNNTSVVLNLAVDGYRALFTADAGVPALTAAADYMDYVGLATKYPDVFHVPHHGSRHNLDPGILDRLLGPKTSDQRGGAYVSVGQEADDHPRPEIANAIKRRGYPVYDTRGQNIWWNRGAPPRSDYGPIEPLPWLEESRD